MIKETEIDRALACMGEIRNAYVFPFQQENA
jgi:hypothetical protein